ISTTATLSDSLPSSVPKFESSGANWPIFSLHFQDAVNAKGFWGHFDGSNPCPTLTSLSVPLHNSPALSKTDREVITKWDKDKQSARSLLTQKIPDAALMLVHNLSTVHQRWAKIQLEYTQKGAWACAELCTQFME
ncbi:hypothetical protein BDQ12DRAFT_575539, partial [Crucibulum laeve]